MKVTTTVAVEIKGIKHDLTATEARELLRALQSALGAVEPTPFQQPLRQWLDTTKVLGPMDLKVAC